MIPKELIYLIMQYAPAYGVSPVIIRLQILRMKSISILQNQIYGLNVEERVEIRKKILYDKFLEMNPWNCRYFEYTSDKIYLCIFPNLIRSSEPSYLIIYS